MRLRLQFQEHTVFDDDHARDAAGEVISRTVLFAYPVDTQRLRLVVARAASEVLARVDLLGMPAGQRYRLNPYLDQMVKETEVPNNEVGGTAYRDHSADNLVEGASLTYYFTTGTSGSTRKQLTLTLYRSTVCRYLGLLGSIH